MPFDSWFTIFSDSDAFSGPLGGAKSFGVIPAAAAAAAADNNDDSAALPGLMGVTGLEGGGARADVGDKTFIGDAAPAGTSLRAAGYWSYKTFNSKLCYSQWKWVGDVELERKLQSTHMKIISWLTLGACFPTTGSVTGKTIKGFLIAAEAPVWINASIIIDKKQKSLDKNIKIDHES